MWRGHEQSQATAIARIDIIGQLACRHASRNRAQSGSASHGSQSRGAEFRHRRYGLTWLGHNELECAPVAKINISVQLAYRLAWKIRAQSGSANDESREYPSDHKGIVITASGPRDDRHIPASRVPPRTQEPSSRARRVTKVDRVEQSHVAMDRRG